MLTSISSFNSAITKNAGTIIILPPTNITATNVTSTTATINFTPSSGTITGYIATTNDGAQGSGTTSPITITGLANNVTYTVTVVAYNLFGNSKASASVSFTTLIPYTDGLQWWRYAGYANDNVTYTDTATLQALAGKTSSGSGSVDFTDIGTATQQNQPVNGADQYSVLWLGYFFTGVYSGTFTFYTSSDDCSYLWIGAVAQSGYTTSNCVVNNAGAHGMTQRSGTISLNANTYYPIRILFGENGGGDNIIVWFNLPGNSSNIYNGAGYYYTLGSGGSYSSVTSNTGIPRQPSITSTILTSTTLSLNFTQPTNVTNGSTYSLFYGSTIYGTTTYPATSITATGLSPNTSYNLYLTATNTYGTSIITTTITGLTTPVFPAYELILDTSYSALINVVNFGSSASVTNTLSIYKSLPSVSINNTGTLYTVSGLAPNTNYLINSTTTNTSGSTNYALGQLTNTSPLITIASGASTASFSYYSQYICIGCYGNGIYVSTDYGASFNKVVNEANASQSAISDSGQYMFVACNNIGRLYYSSNYGSSFTLVTIGANISGVSCSSTGSNVYATDMTNGGIYYSINYGVTWSSINAVAANLSNLTCNFAGTVAYFTSTSTGKAYSYTLKTNSAVIFSPGGTSNVSGIAISSNGAYIYVCNYGGLCYTSTNAGSTFTAVSLPSSNYASISCDSTGQYVYVHNSTTSFYYSSNYGATFSSVIFPSSTSTISISSNGMFLGISSGSGLYISTNSFLLTTTNINNNNSLSVIDASFGAVTVSTNSYNYYLNSGFTVSSGYNYTTIPGWKVNYSNMAIAVANGSNTFFTATMPTATSQAFVVQLNGTYKTPSYCILSQLLTFPTAGSYTLNFSTIPRATTDPTFINLTAILGNYSTSSTLANNTSSWNSVSMPVTISSAGNYNLLFYFSSPLTYLNTAINSSIALTSIGFSITYNPISTLNLTSKTATTAVLNFTTPTTNGITPTSYTTNIGSGSGTPSAYTISGLSANTNYTLSLISNYPSGYYASGYSLAGSSNTSPSISVLTVPASPSLALSSITTTTATIVITDVLGSTINNGYTLTTSPIGGSGSGPNSAYVINGLASNTNYTLSITTNNSSGSSLPGSLSCTTVPSPPTSVVATKVSDSVVTVTITAPSGNGTITQYSVTSNPGNITVTSSSSTLTVTGLIANTSYTFTSKATNSSGTSTSSSPSTAVTTNANPNPPTNLSVTGTTTSTATVSFTPPVGSVNGYILSTSNGYQATETSSPITITGLGASTTYTITIVAVNYNGSSIASSSISATTGAGQAGTGGSVVQTGNTYTHTITSTLTFTANNQVVANVLLVGGGGGGGYDGGGGGGGGGILEQSLTIPAGSYTVTIGTGGRTTNGYSLNGGKGGDTSIGALLVAYGGGGGGDNHGTTSQSSPYADINGGTGGGSGATDGNNFTGPGTGTSGQGYGGGNGIRTSGGGGGSKTAAGGNASGSTAGLGANGYTSSITGSSVVYGGGGGGGAWGGGLVGSAGGSGGGGYGASSGTNGSAGTYYGGGGGGSGSGGTTSGAGYQGIAIISYTGGTTSPTNIGVPNQPTISTVTTTSTGITVNFIQPNNVLAGSTYRLFYGGTTYGTASYPATSITSNSLSPNTQYLFNLTATNTFGTSIASTLITATTPLPAFNIGTTSLITATTATISFTAPSGAAAGTTYSAVAGGVTYGTANYPDVSLNITGLSSNTNYTFSIIARNSNGITPSTGSLSFLTIPDPPIILTATTISDAIASIAFTPPTGNGTITNYTVKSNPSNITATGTSSPISVIGLAANSSYTFTMTTTNSAGTSAESSASNSITTNLNPSPPTNVTVTSNTNSSVTLSFTPPVGSTVTGYIASDLNGFTGSSLTSPVTILGLVTNASYTFSIRSINTNGSSVASSSVTVTVAYIGGATSTTATNTGIPDQPTIGNVTTTNNTATINFTAPNGATSGTTYTLYYGGTTYGTTTYPTTTITATGLTLNTQYLFYLTATNTFGKSIPTTLITAVTTLAAPTIGTASGITTTSSRLTFTAPAGAAVGTTYNVISVGTTYGTATYPDASLNITGLSPNTTYPFTMTAVNNNGTSPSSGSYSITTLPGPPTDLIVSSYSDTAATITFTSSAGTASISNYIVTSSPTGITANRTTSPITITGLAINTAYTFTITATNSQGTSSASVASEPITTSLLPNPPTGLTASTINPLSLIISFTPPIGTITYYRAITNTGKTSYGTISPIVISDLSSNTEYTVTINSTNTNGSSIDSSAVTATTTTIISGSVLSAPIIGTASSITTTSVIIGFTAPSGSASGTVYTAYSGGIAYGAATYPSTSIYINGLTTNTAYVFTIKATNQYGSSVASGTLNVATYPLPPTSLSIVSKTSNSATIGFVAPSGNATISTFTATDASGLYTGSSITSPIIVNGLAPLTNYTFSLKTTNITTTTVFNTFVPSSITGMRLWLDSSDNTTLILSGSNVTQWNDKSGVGNNISQANAGSQPTTGTYYNNRLLLNFTSNKFMTNTTMIFPEPPYTIFAVGYTSTNGYGRLLAGYPDGYLFLGSGSGVTQFAPFTGNGSWTDTNTASPATSITSMSIMCMTNTGTTTGLIPYVNGTALTTKNGTASGFTGIYVGAYAGGQYWNGYIGEILVYNSILSTTDRQKMEGYLAWKWGVQASLSNTHPYYVASPSSPTVINVTETSVPSNAISVQTTLLAPIIGTATGITATGATISFTAPTGAAGGTTYTISSSSVSYGTVSYPATSFVLNNLSSNTVYSFTITATNNIGTSAASSAVAVTTIPSPPSNISVSSSSDISQIVTFTTSTGNASITNYTITSNPGSITGTGTSSPITITGLAPNTSYIYTVTATNSQAISVASSPSSAFTTSSVPNPPTGLSALTLAPTYITVSFTAPVLGIVSYYKASTSTGITSYSNSSPITISGLSASTSYTITVQSVDSNGTSVASNSVTASTTATSTGNVLVAPTIVNATLVTTTSCVLNLTAPTGATTGTSYIAYVGTTVYGSSLYPATSINIYGLTPNTAYAFTIIASNQYGYSVASSVLNVATVPLSPTSLSLVNYTSGSVTIGFTTVSGTATISTYTATDASGLYTGTNTTSPITVSSLSSGTNYNFSITATNTITTTVVSNFNPTTITGITLWLDAKDPYNNGTQPSNGAIVNTWYDKSGAGRNGSSSSGVTYSTTGFNNLPAFSITNLFTQANFFTGSMPNTNSTMTIFAVALMSSSSTGSGRVIGFSNGNGVNDYNNTGFMGFLRQSGTGFGPYRNGTYVNNNPPSYSTPYLWECWYDGTSEYATVQVGNSTTIGSASSSGNFAITYYCIGSNTNTGDGGGPMTGYISEIVVYNTCLSATDRQKMEGYLSWKWGIQGNLPTSHPYYSASPTSPTVTAVTKTSNPSSTIAVTTLLAAPTIGTATSITSTGATISFTPPLRAAAGTTYTISSNSVSYGTTSYPATSINAINLASNTTYTFTMIATTSVGTSTPSTSLSVTTLPGFPQAISPVVYSDTVIILYFNPCSGNGTITNYTAYSTVDNTSISGLTSPFIFTGLRPNTTYSFTMSAVSSQGTSGISSASGQVTTKSVPTYPSNVSVQSITSTSAYIYFTPCLGTVSYYTATTNTGITTFATSSPIAVSGLSPSTTYTVSLQTVDQYGTSGIEYPITITTNRSSDISTNYPTTTLTFDACLNVISSSNLVSSWGDTTNTYFATQSTNKPTINTSYLNSSSAIVYTAGTNQVLTTGSLTNAGLSNISELTLFFVMKITSNTTSQNFFSSSGAYSYASIQLIVNGSGFFQITLNSYNTNFTTTMAIPINTPFILMVNFSSTTGLGTSYLRLNGVDSAIFVHNPFSTILNTNAFDFGGWSVGNRTINGGISQVMIYNRNLLQGEVKNVEYYLSTRWNIYVANNILFAPTITSVTSIMSSTATINFTAPQGASTGTIYTAISGGIIYGTAAYPATTILLGNLATNTTYSFALTTTNIYGKSPLSSTMSFTTLPAIPIVTVLTSSTNSITVSFNGSSGTNPITYVSSIGTGSGTPSSYTISGLSQVTSYTFTITATNSTGSTVSSNVIYTTALPAPTNLYSGLITTTSAIVYFTAPTQVTTGTSFTLYISGSSIGSVSYPTVSFSLSGLASNTTYPITVTATNTFGTSIASSIIYITTLPSAPTNITVVSATISTIIISFTDQTGNAEIGYSLTSGTGYGNSSAFTLPNLNANSSYTFAIIATNSSGSATSNPITVFTPLPPPTGLAASSITTSIVTVSFTPPIGAVNGTTYTISSGGSSYGTASYPATTINATTLVSNTNYLFTMTSTINNAVSIVSTSVSVNTLPNPPTNISASVVSNTVATVTFTASTGTNTITSYTVTSSPGSRTATGTSSPISINGLAANTAYTFTVTATNSQGTSSASTASSAITISPTNSSTVTSASFSIPTTSGQIVIGSISGTYTSFNITRTGGSQGTFAAIGQTGTSYTDPTSLTNNTQYTYTITPVKDGSNSNTFTAITNPNNSSTPGSIYTLATVNGLNLTYSGASSSLNSIGVTWTNNGYTTLYLANTTKSGANYTAVGTTYNSTTNGSSDTGLTTNTQYTYRFTTQNGDGYYVANSNCQTTVNVCTWATCNTPTSSSTTSSGTTIACTGTFSGVYITYSGGSGSPSSGTTIVGTNSISQVYTGMTISSPYIFTCYPVNAMNYQSSNSVNITVVNPYDGLTSATAAPSATFLASQGVTTNGTYWITLPTVGATQVYCILDRAVDGGGWMMAMKATRGTTFQYTANYWTTNNTLNPANTNRNDGDAKYNTMNYSGASDLLALWPDIVTVGGSLTLTNASYNCWAWLQNRFTSAGTFYIGTGENPSTTTVSGITTSMTLIDWFTKISSVRYFIQDAITWSGWKSGIFSSQTDVRFYGFNYMSNTTPRTRWGFGWNENGGGVFPGGNMGSDDVMGGIGMANGSYSSGDLINCCNNTTGVNRTARVEIYLRDSSGAPSAPTIGTASKSGSTVTVPFTSVTGATYYTAFSNTGGFFGSSTTTPITITGVTAGTYTFTVKASNASGTSLASAASNSLTV